MAFLIERIGQQSDDGTTTFEGVNLAPADHVRRIMAGVDITEQALRRLVDAEEKGSVAIGGGRLVNQAVDARHEHGQVGGSVHGHATK